MVADKQRRAFISYSRTNKEFTVKLTKGLRSAGFPVWFDQLDIPTGSRWDDEVEKALRECSIFLIILTPASIASENVKDEIGYAIDHGKRILPVLLENCEVPLRLRRFQYIDFTTKSFEEGFESAKELLSDLVDEASVPVVAKASVIETQIAQKAEEERAAQAKAEIERKAKQESDRLATQKANADQKNITDQTASGTKSRKTINDWLQTWWLRGLIAMLIGTMVVISAEASVNGFTSSYFFYELIIGIVWGIFGLVLYSHRTSYILTAVFSVIGFFIWSQIVFELPYVLFWCLSSGFILSAIISRILYAIKKI